MFHLEEAGGHVETVAIVAHNNIRLVSPIKLLVCAVQIVIIRILRWKGGQNHRWTEFGSPKLCLPKGQIFWKVSMLDAFFAYSESL